MKTAAAFSLAFALLALLVGCMTAPASNPKYADALPETAAAAAPRGTASSRVNDRETRAFHLCRKPVSSRAPAPYTRRHPGRPA